LLRVFLLSAAIAIPLVLPVSRFNAISSYLLVIS
jgi:hypothetical protein